MGDESVLLVFLFASTRAALELEMRKTRKALLFLFGVSQFRSELAS